MWSAVCAHDHFIRNSWTVLLISKLVLKYIIWTSGDFKFLALLQVFPIRFVEVNYISLDKHVTMADSTGHRLWHMRMQECSNGPLRVISNGWREFCYDHSLKENDALVFTLLSFSHFMVEFCSSESTSTTRSMYPTREEDKYPWNTNNYRMECLSWRRSSENSHYKVSGPSSDTYLSAPTYRLRIRNTD